jgi:DNA end-binding protein Ku
MEYAPVAPRAYWKGYLRLSLVSCPIQLFPATSEREKIRFHQINRKTGNRIKYCKIDAVTGEQVNAEDIVMGYEVSKGEYMRSSRPLRSKARIRSRSINSYRKIRSTISI